MDDLLPGVLALAVRLLVAGVSCVSTARLTWVTRPDYGH